MKKIRKFFDEAKIVYILVSVSAFLFGYTIAKLQPFSENANGCLTMLTIILTILAFANIYMFLISDSGFFPPREKD